MNEKRRLYLEKREKIVGCLLRGAVGLGMVVKYNELRDEYTIYWFGHDFSSTYRRPDVLNYIQIFNRY